LRIVPKHQISLRAPTPPQPPADLFVPAPREALEPGPEPEPDPQPDPPTPTAAEANVRARGLHPVAVVAVLLSGLLGVVTIGAFSEPDRATTRNAPFVAPHQQLDGADDTDGADGTGQIGIAATAVQAGTSVSLPGPGSSDWVAPGARSDGALVRADLAEESIEFRAADTQPGLPGVFRLSWSGGTPPYERGDATTMLGVRPGGWVAFVVRPLGSPADLVVHLSGSDVAVTVVTDAGSIRKTLSATAAVATVTLPAATAATVTVTAEGNQDVAVSTAELQSARADR
jgi:hypothetical protein